jgi:5-(carboxyamino)imidazole ribonucleotide synthase
MSRSIVANSGKNLGILGGGQLSRMLAESAQRLGYSPVPFCSAADDPAAQVCREHVIGKLTDDEALKQFFSKISIAAFESDFLPFEILRKYADVKFLPELSTLESLSDKLNQKELCQKLSIPTSKFEIYENGDLGEWISNIVKKFSSNVVFKWARGGYDGKGVHIFSGDISAAEKFCSTAIGRGTRIFAEEKISFVRELAQLTTFSTAGEFAFYPLVISEQLNGICSLVTGPAVSLGVAAAIETRAREAAEKIARELNLVGTFAIEFFENSAGQLFVNELAPRVHNSGHFSIDSAECSQFENHWRALLGLPLGSTRTAPAFAMQNLISPSAKAHGNISKLGVSSGAFHFYWYGKKEPKPARKMGHINLVASSVEDLKRNLPQLRDLEREWLSKFGERS